MVKSNIRELKKGIAKQELVTTTMNIKTVIGKFHLPKEVDRVLNEVVRSINKVKVIISESL